MSGAAARATAKPKLILNDGQKTARLAIVKAVRPKRRHLLTGHAGTGKTTLLQVIVADLLKLKMSVSVTAPTHKAVSVLANKMSLGRVVVTCQTIHSLLGVEPKPGPDGRLVLKRRKGAQTPNVDVVIIDECSMIGAELLHHINLHLQHCFVLFVGDSAQLPPIGEKISATFETPHRSHLSEIIRQEADNPVLQAANAIRETQTHDDMEWSWCKPVRLASKGVFLPGPAIDLWLQRAFLSDEFKRDNDRFRYLCWTNAKVARINAKVRFWLYGDIDSPFAPGERALIRSPIVRDDTIIFATNDEAVVEDISMDYYHHDFPERPGLESWSVDVPSWAVTLQKDPETTIEVHISRDDDIVNEINDALKSQARINGGRWEDFYAFKDGMGHLQAVYALTVHNSQGSTFGTAFLDLPDIRKRERSNLLEMKQLLYTGATRPSTSLILVGV